MASQFETEGNEVKNSFAEAVFRRKTLIWNTLGKRTRMEEFMDIIQNKYGIALGTYSDLHKWSVKNCGAFWEEIFKYFDIIHSEPYDQVLPNERKIFGLEWFRGLKFNYAENVLRYRDDRVALICLDEEGGERIITYSKLYEEVKQQAAAWRHHGLKIGDAVACYMPMVEEQIFAMLACTSIGAIWGGIFPYFGHKATESFLRPMKPKFFLVVDTFFTESKEMNISKMVQMLVRDVPSIEKIIIFSEKRKTLNAEIYRSRYSCSLNEFLNTGSQDQQNFNSDIIFEQLPFNHPVSINFTSGTTGIPKGIVHAAGTYLPVLMFNALHWNCTREDVILNLCQSRSMFRNMSSSMLSIGATSVLCPGNPLTSTCASVWDIMSTYKVSMMILGTNIADYMEKANIVPGPSCNLTNFRMMMMCGSLVKFRNFEFCQKLKQDLFVGSFYGQAEVLHLSGFHLNSPAYSGEIQGVILGADIKVFDTDGKSVKGQVGDLVICSPVPHFPLYFLNDTNGEKFRSKYLTKFPGVWLLNDKGAIDPETNGLVVVGRTDLVFNPQGPNFGPDDIYFAIQDMDEISDSLCVSQNSRSGGERVILFLKLAPSVVFDETLSQNVSKKIREELTPWHIPQVVMETEEIPFNVSGKKMELLVTEIINTNKIPEVTTCRNSKCLEFYRNIPELQGF